jgi:hypothetical protein
MRHLLLFVTRKDQLLKKTGHCSSVAEVMGSCSHSGVTSNVTIVKSAKHCPKRKKGTANIVPDTFVRNFAINLSECPLQAGRGRHAQFEISPNPT